MVFLAWCGTSKIVSATSQQHIDSSSFLLVYIHSCWCLTRADNQTQEATKTTKWEGKLNDLIWTFEDDAPRFRNAKWQAVFENQIKSTPLTITAFASPLFSLPLGEDEVKWTVWLTKENIWKRFSTLSQIAVLEGEALEVSAYFHSILPYSLLSG
jgi:hypothetical protein